VLHAFVAHEVPLKLSYLRTGANPTTFQGGYNFLNFVLFYGWRTKDQEAIFGPDRMNLFQHDISISDVALVGPGSLGGLTVDIVW